MQKARGALVWGLAGALALGAPLAVPTTALADPATQLQEASNQLGAFGEQLSSIQDELASQTSALEDTQYQIGEKQAKIQKTNEQLDSARATLGKRIRSSYKTRETSLLSVLLGSSSIDDFVGNAYVAGKINESDAQAIAKVTKLQQKLTEEQSDLEARQSEQKKSVEAMQAKAATYEKKVDEARNYYESLDSQVQEQLASQDSFNEDGSSNDGDASNNVATAIEAVKQDSEAPAQTSKNKSKSSSGSQKKTNSTSSSNKNDSKSSQKTEQKSESRQQNSSGQSGSRSNSSSNKSSSGKSNAGTKTSTKSTFGGGGLSSAYSCIGCPYVWGATGPSSFDCSGLVCYCYGYKRGRTTYAMISSLKSSGGWKTSMSELNVGDLVFPSVGHVGIYIGNGQMIHAPSPGRTVCIAKVYAFVGGGTY